jgi:hypothetical protein
MWAPLTPVATRTSLKKIIISSPSQEVLRFLALPNPSAAEDPRSRIHILTPKSKHRSLSKTQLHQPAKTPLIINPSSPLPNRDCFIRKKSNQAIWKKTEVKFRCEKLKIRNSDERLVSSLENSQSSEASEGPQRLDMTFGPERFWNCIKA